MVRKKFGREDIADCFSKENDCTKKDAYFILDKFFPMIAKLVASGQIVHIEGFGDFFAKERKGGLGRNPATGETHPYEGRNKPKFNPAKKFVDEVNSK